MALSPVYAAILQDLNKAVAHGQPEDVLQFCANWVSRPSMRYRGVDGASYEIVICKDSADLP
jgi:hypothetical protein